MIGTAGEAIQRLAFPMRRNRTAEQHSGRVCRDLPSRNCQPRLVPSHDRAQVDGINLREEGARMQAEIGGTAE